MYLNMNIAWSLLIVNIFLLKVDKYLLFYVFVERKCVFAGLLYTIHGIVRPHNQLLAVLRIRRIGRRSDTAVNIMLLTHELERLLENLQALDYRSFPYLGISALQNQDKLVARKTIGRKDLGVQGLQSLRNLLKRLIARHMPVIIVDALEIINIQHDNGTGLPVRNLSLIHI